MELTEELFESKDFLREFWRWFDSLSIDQKKLFWYYHSDMAKINFFNRIYRYK